MRNTFPGWRCQFLVPCLVAVFLAWAASAAPQPHYHLQEERRDLGWLWKFPQLKSSQRRSGLASPEDAPTKPVAYQLQEEGRRKNEKKKRLSSYGGKTLYFSQGSSDNSPFPLGPQGSSSNALTTSAPQGISSAPWGWGWMQGLMGSSETTTAQPIWSWINPGNRLTSGESLIPTETQISELSVGVVKPSYGFFSNWWSSTATTTTTTEATPVTPGICKGCGGGSETTESTTSEVLLIRYPQFMATIGKGISRMSSAVSKFGQDVSQSITSSLASGWQTMSSELGGTISSVVSLVDDLPEEKTQAPQTPVFSGQLPAPGIYVHTNNGVYSSVPS